MGAHKAQFNASRSGAATIVRLNKVAARHPVYTAIAVRAITRADQSRSWATRTIDVAANHTILVLNGPNLNLLGTREPEIYGTETLEDIERRSQARAAELGIEVAFRQSNTEGELVDWIQGARQVMDGIIINAGAFTHTSVAILDALKASELPVVEIHLSNIFRRETFRHHSYVSQAASGLVCGFGGLGYSLALEAIAHLISDDQGGR